MKIFPGNFLWPVFKKCTQIPPAYEFLVNRSSPENVKLFPTVSFVSRRFKQKLSGTSYKAGQLIAPVIPDKRGNLKKIPKQI